MDRPIVYPGSIPQDTDLLKANQSTMVALAYLAQATLGNGPLADGLACTPTTPASLSVLVGPGSICSVQNLEATAYGSLTADTTDQVVKQGIVLGNTTLTLTPPGTSGQSVVYLIQAQYQDVDGGSTVLPYYNSSNPSVPYSGPSNSGTPQNTIRQGKCVLGLKTGIAATTGSQAAPSPDAGWVGLWAITVANGATTVVSGNIALATAAPFISYKLTDRLAKQNNLSELTSVATAQANLGVSNDIRNIIESAISSSGTYTPSPGMRFVQIRVIGGGGAGGSAAGGGGAAAAAGGGAGGFAEGIFTAAMIGASQTVTIGGGGSPGAAGNNAGNSGGTTSVGTLISAAGGAGGAGCANATTSQFTSAGSGGVGGAGSGGTIFTTGNAGGVGIAFGAVPQAMGGAGGTSLFGDAGQAIQTGGSLNGLSASGVGAAGSGAAVTSTSRIGGSGAAGIVYLIEFCNQ